MTIRRALAAPVFVEDPHVLVDLAVSAEESGFDGFFVWDHVVWSNDGLAGPPVVDPWAVLAVIAARTSRITIGTMVTPPSRRRPQVLARQTATIDRLSGGRLVLGVGLGSPDGDFALFGDVVDPRTRAALMDESLEVLAGLWSGEEFSYAGVHHRIGPVSFRPTPAAGSVPVWVGGVLPNTRPMRRAARWQGAVPIAYGPDGIVRPSAAQLAGVRDLVREQRGHLDGYDLVVWDSVAADPAALAEELPAYAEAGVTWWVESPMPGQSADWLADLHRRAPQGPLGR